MAKVIIDSLPSSAERYVDNWAIVAVDVIRFTTTAATAISIGRSVFPARSSDEAISVASGLTDPLLAGELGGNVPYGFDLPNSPVAVMALRQIPCGQFTSGDRPIVLVSSSGAQLVVNALSAEHLYLGCLRNISALVAYLVEHHENVAVLGAGTRGDFRREDQMCCAWIAERLIEQRYSPENEATLDFVKKWHGVSSDVIREGRSAEYLRRTGQVHDLEFVLHYQDDLAIVPKKGGERTFRNAADRWS